MPYREGLLVLSQGVPYTKQFHGMWCTQLVSQPPGVISASFYCSQPGALLSWLPPSTDKPMVLLECTPDLRTPHDSMVHDAMAHSFIRQACAHKNVSHVCSQWHANPRHPLNIALCPSPCLARHMLTNYHLHMRKP